VLLNPFIPHDPTDKQARFLLQISREAFYGGAAGGGKSDALLMAALQYIHIPNYAAILFRRSYTDLALPGALMDRAYEWLGSTNAIWRGSDKTWRFPSGATLTFGYLDAEASKYRYQGAEFQFVGFDELTQFSESQYRFLFSRLRRLGDSDIPIRMRAASNPGGVGHDWVKARFIEGDQAERPWVRATLVDNPFLDQDEYERALNQLDPITRAQLLNGDWSARNGGSLFRREWFEVVEQAPAHCQFVRYWDLAATEVKDGKDPDYTVGALVGLHDGIWYVTDIQRVRTTPQGVENLVRQTAEIDGRNISIRMEEEPGSSGKVTTDHYARRVLAGWDYIGIRATGSKVERCRPVSAAAQAGNVKIVSGSWISDFLDEMEAFPEGSHDDIVDSVSGAVAELGKVGTPRVRWLT
jgi:predicted phage terminase large subunit-like protein